MDEAQVVEAWKKVVDVQQHFNDIQMRIRTVAVTVMTAIVGGSGYAANAKWEIDLPWFSFCASILILLAGIVAMAAFWYMDRWYHIFLRASVAHGMKIEKMHVTNMEELGLATAITEASHNTQLVIGKTSVDRLNVFYFGLVSAHVILILMFLMMEKLA